MSVIKELAQEYNLSSMRQIRDGANHHFELAMEYARGLNPIDVRLEAMKQAMIFNDLALACAKIIDLGK